MIVLTLAFVSFSAAFLVCFFGGNSVSNEVGGRLNIVGIAYFFNAAFFFIPNFNGEGSKESSLK